MERREGSGTDSRAEVKLQREGRGGVKNQTRMGRRNERKEALGGTQGYDSFRFFIIVHFCFFMTSSLSNPVCS